MLQPAANFFNNLKRRLQTVKALVSEPIAAMLAVKHHTDVICGFGRVGHSQIWVSALLYDEIHLKYKKMDFKVIVTVGTAIVFVIYQAVASDLE